MPAFAIVALAVGLAACQTPTAAAPAVEKPAVVSVPVPKGIETNRYADRIQEQIERREGQTRDLIEQLRGHPADRVQAALDKLDRVESLPAPEAHLPGWVNRILAQIEFEKAQAEKGQGSDTP